MNKVTGITIASNCYGLWLAEQLGLLTGNGYHVVGGGSQMKHLQRQVPVLRPCQINA